MLARTDTKRDCQAPSAPHSSNDQEALAETLRIALEPIASELVELLRKARRGDAPSVHRARVALRRLRVGIAIMGGGRGVESRKADKLAMAMRRIEQCLAPTRDDHVLAEDLRQWLRRKGSTRGARSLQARLVREYQRHLRALARDLKRQPIRRSMRRLRRWLTGDSRRLHPRPNPSAPSLRPVRPIIREEIERSYREVLSREPQRPGEFDAIHKFRSSIRSLRFTLELVQGPLSVADAAIDVLREAQRRLGALHDDVVAAARIEGWLARGKVARSALVNAYLARRLRSRDRRFAQFNEERRAPHEDSLHIALSQALGDMPSKNHTPADRDAAAVTSIVRREATKVSHAGHTSVQSHALRSRGRAPPRPRESPSR